MGKDWGQLSLGPSKEETPYPVKQEGEWWQRSQSPERLDDDCGELDSAFMERQTPGGEDKGYFEGPRGNKGESAPGQLQKPSVRRTRRDDFELESNHEEREWENMHPSQNRDTCMGAGYTSPRGQGLLYQGVSNRYRVNEAPDYSRDLNGRGMPAVVQTYREHDWPEGGGVVIPLRGTPEGVGEETNKPPNKGEQG